MTIIEMSELAFAVSAAVAMVILLLRRMRDRHITPTIPVKRVMLVDLVLLCACIEGVFDVLSHATDVIALQYIATGASGAVVMGVLALLLSYHPSRMPA